QRALWGAARRFLEPARRRLGRAWRFHAEESGRLFDRLLDAAAGSSLTGPGAWRGDELACLTRAPAQQLAEEGDGVVLGRRFAGGGARLVGERFLNIALEAGGVAAA